MDCDMCGDRTAEFVVRLEGTNMNVCGVCKTHGTFIRKIEDDNRTKVNFQNDRQPELIETVRDNTSQLLRNYREKKGFSVEEFSKKLNIKSSTYQHYESGHTKPDIDTARKLERVIGQTLVVHLKVGKVDLHSDDGPSMTLGDFIKKK